MTEALWDAGWDERRAKRLRTMKQRATGLLVAAALVFIATHFMGDATWVGYLQAASEAAMVGGVADWFAVTALFRHPLGIPIPHTALIPRGKDAIGRGLGEFVTRNFLDSDHLAERVADADPAGTLAAWLADPDHASSVAGHAAGIIASASQSLDDKATRAHLQQWVGNATDRLELGSLSATLAASVIERGHHRPIVDAALTGLQRAIAESQPSLRHRVYQESPWWVPTQVDDAVFARLYLGFQRFLGDLAANPDHELRHKLDDALLEAAHQAQTSPEWREAAAQMRDGLVSHPATQAWIDGLWADLRRSISEAADQPEHEWRARLADLITGFAERLRTDAGLRDRINQSAQTLARTAAQQFGGEAARLIASTVEKWDAEDTSRRLELQVGRDLQFIRINGTLVGGLVGLLIHAVTRAFG